MIGGIDFLLVVAVAIGTVGVIYSIHSVVSRHRAEQELQRRLDESEDREQLAEAILDKPNQTNLENGRRLIVKTVSSMDPQHRKQIAYGLNQPQTRGRNAYIAKVVVGHPRLRNHELSASIAKRNAKPNSKVRFKARAKKVGNSERRT